jgi:UDP-glucose 4-epimerase
VKALVTGGAGFIGSTLVDRLVAEGHRVDVVDDLSTGSLTNLAEARSEGGHRLSFQRLDIRDPAVVELVQRRQPEVVFHLAAQADVRVSVQRPGFDAEVNVLGSINVLEGARLGGARKIVFASSGGTIYGEPEELPVRESHPQRPLSPYGAAKKAVADYLGVYRELHGLEFTALALANVYGPRQDPFGEAGVVSIFAGKLLAGEQCTIFGDGEQTRDFVYVGDIVRGLLAAMQRLPREQTVFNLCTGRSTSVLQLARTIAELCGHEPKIAFADPRAGEIRVSLGDASAAERHLGWQAEVGLKEGLAKTLS